MYQRRDPRTVTSSALAARRQAWGSGSRERTPALRRSRHRRRDPDHRRTVRVAHQRRRPYRSPPRRPQSRAFDLYERARELTRTLCSATAHKTWAGPAEDTYPQRRFRLAHSAAALRWFGGIGSCERTVARCATGHRRLHRSGHISNGSGRAEVSAPEIPTAHEPVPRKLMVPPASAEAQAWLLHRIGSGQRPQQPAGSALGRRARAAGSARAAEPRQSAVPCDAGSQRRTRARRPSEAPSFHVKQQRCNSPGQPANPRESGAGKHIRPRPSVGA